ncbi:hypothetical protein Ro45lw_18 [Escherichia phage Ro45lw]|uniref:Uncharacterized protein n=1 Tax=Escherichia phage Ro45lw TaxID=2498616 RepID=A0A3S9URV5_9CAUD|nr:hypothetical protein HOU92_gp18 [Escherichia phage Ro45lw]AZS13006.1 hypothetical protein Ro45lw_18 [Escherichia phage Ro45lw]
MIKFIEFLGRLVVRGYSRAASVERAVSTKAAKGSAEAQELADRLMVTSFDAAQRANGLDKKAEQLKGFFN